MRISYWSSDVCSSDRGCGSFEEIKALEKTRMEQVCSRMRQDGPFIEAGENDNLIVQRLNSDPSSYGIFGYSFLYENQDTLQAVTVNGVEPNPETIASGDYGVSRTDRKTTRLNSSH